MHHAEIIQLLIWERANEFAFSEWSSSQKLSLPLRYLNPAQMADRSYIENIASLPRYTHGELSLVGLFLVQKPSPYPSPMITRRQIRAKVMQAIYACITSGEVPEPVFNLLLKDIEKEVSDLEQKKKANRRYPLVGSSLLRNHQKWRLVR